MPSAACMAKQRFNQWIHRCGCTASNFYFVLGITCSGIGPDLNIVIVCVSVST